LGLQATAAGTHAALGIVHGLLERVLLPSEHVVAVLAVSSVVSHAEVEGLRAVGRPFSLVVELAGVPDNLQLLVQLVECRGKKLTSSMTCGIVTGWVDGHFPAIPVPEKPAGPSTGYATCDLWSGESRLTPSQQLRRRQWCICQYIRSNLRWVQDVGAYATWTCVLWEALSVELGIGTRSGVVSSKVVGAVATEATLCFPVLAHTVGGVTNKHSESLIKSVSVYLAARLVEYIQA
jgi:hypothetical protein